ncbi:4651_t:CDS:2 [Entrophospora sp. SA101]|nr:3559_t:CDS:2 [Entrophospora sp. SA101]CAJ0752222.1 12548_t:CDS:2 [Entrophospora sp. SA101]CAJ0765472.1 4651_t:CDS:2 [Entrophospora sp. SA101]
MNSLVILKLESQTAQPEIDTEKLVQILESKPYERKAEQNPVQEAPLYKGDFM